MAKRIIKIKTGEEVPLNAKYLHTEKCIECGDSRYEWRNTPGIMGIIPIFGTETCYKITPRYEVTYHYYEIEDEIPKSIKKT